MKKITAQQKREAVLKVVEDGKKVAHVAREYEVSRKTIYSWIKIYRQQPGADEEIFKPRYVKGKDHPKAKYPDIEKKLLQQASDNPDLTIKQLADKLPVSVWTVWSLLNKYDLNTSHSRNVLAGEILRELAKRSAKKKREAVFRVLNDNEPVARVARDNKVARKTVYSWIDRYKEEDYNSSLETFKPQYVEGKEHPGAKYPEIEEQLLLLVANNPELSMQDLAQQVPVSVWTVWNLLSKRDLNKKQQRYVFAEELLRRREQRQRTLSLDTDFGYVAHQIDLLMAQTRKIPKYAHNNLLKPAYTNIYSAVLLLINSILAVPQQPISLFSYIKHQLVGFARAVSIQTSSLADQFALFTFSVTTFFLSIPKNIFFGFDAVADRLALQMQSSFEYAIQKADQAAEEFAYFNISLLSYFRSTIAVEIGGAIPVPSFVYNFATRLSVSIKQRLDRPATELQLFFRNISSYLRTSPQYSAYYVSLIIVFVISSVLVNQNTRYNEFDTNQGLISSGFITDQAASSQFSETSGNLALVGNDSYRISDNPSFTVQKQVSAFERVGSSANRVLGIQDESENVVPTVSVSGPEGVDVDQIEVQESSTNEFEINIKRPEKLKPGKYKINVQDSSGTKIEKEFGWGMLVLNTDKRVYRVGESVNFAITTLDTNGIPVCDSVLDMSIKNLEKNLDYVLTNKNDQILNNPDCKDNEITMNPDYSANFELNSVGTYRVDLNATVDGEVYSIMKLLSVISEDISEDFVVSRGAPIRTAQGENYPVIIKIKSNIDFRGEIRERLPKSFIALPYRNDEFDIEIGDSTKDYTSFVNKNEDDHQLLIWNVAFEKGQTYSLKYTFSDLGTVWSDYYLGPVIAGSEIISDKWDLIKDESAPRGDVTTENRYSSLRAQDRILNLPNKQLKISIQKPHFQATDKPIIYFESIESTDQQSATSSGFLQRILGSSREQLDESEINNKVNIKVSDANNNIEFETEVDPIDGTVEIPTDTLQPGKHTVTIRDNRTGHYVEHTFIFGVLAINLNKSSYVTGDQAFIQIASLDDKGNTVCNSNLELLLHLPDGTTNSYSVEDNTLLLSDTCGVNNVTDNPDYYINEIFEKTGHYQLILTNLENGYSVTDKFEVKDKSNYAIERISATRINPFLSIYEMKILVSSEIDFSGELIENVPEDFVIIESEDGTVERHSSEKSIKWNLDISSNQISELTYKYQAPKKSPELYLLGPIFLKSDSGEIVYEDGRLWQLASDAYDDVVTDLNPTFRWQLDGNTNEDIQSLNGSGSISYSTGIITNDTGQAFDATGTTMTIPNDPEINTGSGYTFTKRSVSVWIEPDDLTGNKILFEEGGGVNWMALYADGGNLYGIIGEGSTQQGYVSHSLSTGNVYHVGFVIDMSLGSNGLKLYINGQLEDQVNQSAGSDLSSHSGGVGLGGANSNPRNHSDTSINGSWDGRIQDFAYWSEVALSQTDMQDIYTAGAVNGTAQMHYRWRNDESDVNTDPATGSDWLAAEDTEITSVVKNDIIRLRTSVANQESSTESASRTYELQWGDKYGLSSCSEITTWTGVGDGSDEFAMVDTAHITNGESITSGFLANSEGYTFANGEAQDSSDTSDAVGPLGASNYTELEYSIKATHDTVTGRTYCFRLYDTTAATVLDNYINYPQLTVDFVLLGDVIGEVGQDSTDYSGKTINLDNIYVDPIVVVEPITGDNSGGSTNRPANTVITDVTTSSFTVKIQEPDNETDDHGTETFSYIVMEKGAWELPDGTLVEAGELSTSSYYGNGVTGDSDDTCTFTQSFSSAPVVAASLQTDNNTGTPDFLTVSINGITTGSFTCAVEIPDNETNIISSAETIGWVAFEAGTGTNNGNKYEALTTTGAPVHGWTDDEDGGGSDNWYSQSFAQSFSSAPLMVAHKSTRNGADGGWLRYADLTSSRVLLGIDERDDGERSHGGSEDAGIIAFESSGDILGSGILSMDQTNYRFYENLDAIQPTSALASQDASVSGVIDQDILRLRVSIQVGVASLTAGAKSFKLQYGEGTNCSSVGSWSDVGNPGSGNIWRGYDNSTPSDGSTVTSSLLNSQSNTLQSYEESNNSVSNPNTILVGNRGEWDWVIQNNGATDNTDYCFRMVTSSGEALQYTNYPQLKVINYAPTVSSTSLNNGSDIDLIANSTQDVDFTGTITDLNGSDDIVSANGKLYRSGVAAAEDCTADDNNCYVDVSCTLSGCAGNSCTATCTVSMAFFADATDAGTYSSEYWLAWIQATDGLGASGSGFSPASTTEVNSLTAISAPASIGYSNLSPGASSAEQTTTITNAGNRVLDLQVSGVDMCDDYPTCVGNTITVDNQEYSLTTFTYGSGTDLSGTLTTLDTNIAKSSVVPSNSTDDIFWRIGIPSTTIPAVYNGSNTVVGIASP